MNIREGMMDQYARFLTDVMNHFRETGAPFDYLSPFNEPQWNWDGNGQDTFAVRRGNVFYVRNSTTTGVADIVFGYGKAGDEVLVGDWNQDGIDTFAVRRGNMIFIRNDFQPGPAQTVIGYGKATDELLVGDWNADGVDTFAVRRLEPVT